MSSNKQAEVPKVFIDKRTYNLMSLWAYLGGKQGQEITCIGLTSVRGGQIYVKDAYLFDQEGTGGSVDGDDDAIVALMMELDAKGFPPETMRCWMHSHPSTGPSATYLSGTDEANIERWLTGEYLVSIVFDSKGENPYTRIDLKNPRLSIVADLEPIFLEQEDWDWAQKEFKDKVRKPVVVSPAYQGSYKGTYGGPYAGRHGEYGHEYGEMYSEVRGKGGARGGSAGSSSGSSSSSHSSRSSSTSGTKSSGKKQPPNNKPAATRYVNGKKVEGGTVTSIKANENKGGEGAGSTQGNEEAPRPGYQGTGGMTGYGLTGDWEREWEELHGATTDEEAMAAWEKLVSQAEKEDERESQEDKEENAEGIPSEINGDDTSRQLEIEVVDDAEIVDDTDIEIVESLQEMEKYIEEVITKVAQRVMCGQEMDVSAAVQEIAALGISEQQAWEELQLRLIA